MHTNITKFMFENGVFASPQVFVARFTQFTTDMVGCGR
jgi:hypothetical protein